MKSVISSVLSATVAFNFDTNQPYIKEGPTGSNFGYAVGNFKFSDNSESLIVRHGRFELFIFLFHGFGSNQI